MGSLPVDSARDALSRVRVLRLDDSPPRSASAGRATIPPRWQLARAWAALRLRVETNEQATVVVTVLAFVIVSVAIIVAPLTVPWVAYLPFLVLSGDMHSPRRHLLVLGVAVAAILLTFRRTEDIKTDGLGAVVATLAVAMVTLWRSICRAKVGVQGGRGETMLADLRTRLLARARVPALPTGWNAETCVESAYSQRFSGDFVVTRRSQRGRLLEVALVDVSGKGLQAGTRALVLSGAFDALLGSVPPADFMVAANDYVARQDWSEGFASAVYLCLDLETGDYAVSGAGHPPAARFDAHTETWSLIEDGTGPVLGLTGGRRYPCARGTIAPGEALMLYTDGLIEERDSHVDDSIARLMTALDAHACGRFSGVAQGACSQAPAGHCDDRGAVVIWRD